MRLRKGWLLAAALPAFGLLLPAPAGDTKETKSALESDAAGWTDIMPGQDLKGWKRVPIPPGGKLNAKNPWSRSADSKTLHCDGVGVHEMLLYDKELADFIFHAEWSFKPVEGKKGYNSGVYARNSADGKIWHQAQVGNLNVGQIFGDTVVSGDEKLKRININDKVPQRGKPPGEWNVYEMTCKGKSMTLWINGAVTATWNDCQVPKGFVGLEAEGWVIEFRNLKIKEAK
jgi:hypothetical protein